MDTIDIVGNADIVGNVDIVGYVDIVDCWLLKQAGTRLSSIEAISKTPITHLMSIMGLRDASASKNDPKDINMILTTQTIYWMKWIYPAWPPSQFRSKTRRVLMWDTAFGNIWKETHLSWPATSVKSFEPSSLPRAPAYYKNRCYHCPVLHLWKLVCLACVKYFCHT